MTYAELLIRKGKRGAAAYVQGCKVFDEYSSLQIFLRENVA